MPHRRRHEIPGHARFLTFSCYNRLQLFNNDAIKDAFVEAIERSRQKHRFLLTAYVVMPEHVHLLIFPDLEIAKVTDILKSLKLGFSMSVIRRWRSHVPPAPILDRLDHHGVTRFWQRGGGYDRNIYSRDELNEKIKYINENPVARGLVDCPEDWRWSSAGWWRGMENQMIEMDRF
jgi:putative transposase